MPKSKNRPKHKAKLAARKLNIVSQKKQFQKQMNMYTEQMKKMQEAANKAKETGIPVVTAEQTETTITEHDNGNTTIRVGSNDVIEDAQIIE